MKYILIFTMLLTSSFASYYGVPTKAKIVEKYYATDKYTVKRKQGVHYVYDNEGTYSLVKEKILYNTKRTRNLAAEIPYKNGKLHGTIREYSNSYGGDGPIGVDSHILSTEITFKNGLAHGEMREYHGDSTETTMYKHGMTVWVRYVNGEGVITLDEKYINGKISLKVKYYESGNIKEKAHFKDGKYDGVQTRYYKDGKVQNRTMWKNDKMETDSHSSVAIHQAVKNFYDNKGIWAGKFRMGEIVKVRIDSTEKTIKAHVKYEYLPLHGNNRSPGYDQRIFTINISNGVYNVVEMDNYMSARF